MNYSFISDRILEPGLRCVYATSGVNVRLIAVYAFNAGGNGFESTNPDIFPVLSDNIRAALIEEIQEYLVEEFGENEE